MSPSTIVVETYDAIPNPVRDHRMEKLAPGVYRHARLELVFVCLDEAHESQMPGVSRLIAEVTEHFRHQSVGWASARAANTVQASVA